MSSDDLLNAIFIAPILKHYANIASVIFAALPVRPSTAILSDFQLNNNNCLMIVNDLFVFPFLLAVRAHVNRTVQYSFKLTRTTRILPSLIKFSRGVIMTSRVMSQCATTNEIDLCHHISLQRTKSNYLQETSLRSHSCRGEHDDDSEMQIPANRRLIVKELIVERTRLIEINSYFYVLINITAREFM